MHQSGNSAVLRDWLKLIGCAVLLFFGALQKLHSLPKKPTIAISIWFAVGTCLRPLGRPYLIAAFVFLHARECSGAMQSRLSWRRLVLFLSLLLATLLYVLLTTDIFESYEASNSTKLPTTNPPVSTTTEATLATEEAAIPTNTSAPPLHCNGVTQKDYEHMTQLSNKPKCLWPGFSVPMPISQEQRAYVVFTLHPKTNLHLAPVLAALWLVNAPIYDFLFVCLVNIVICYSTSLLIAILTRSNNIPL